MIDIEKIRELARKATQGYWVAIDGAVCIDTTEQVCCGRGYTECCGEPDVKGGLEHIADSSPDDAAFIAEVSPAPVLAMCDEIERLRVALNKAASVSAYHATKRIEAELSAPSIADLREEG